MARPRKDEAPAAKPAGSQPAPEGNGEGMARLAAAEAEANRPPIGDDQAGPQDAEAIPAGDAALDPRDAIEAERNAHVAEVGRRVLEDLPEGSQASSEPGGDRPILRLWVPASPNGRQDCTIGLGPAGLDPEGDALRAAATARSFFGMQG